MSQLTFLFVWLAFTIVASCPTSGRLPPGTRVPPLSSLVEGHGTSRTGRGVVTRRWRSTVRDSSRGQSGCGVEGSRPFQER